MSHSNHADSLHFSQNDFKPDSRQSGLELNHLPNLETLIPQNLSPNKRAIIERLIALHQAESAN
ncbi:hypothetical protein ACKFKF_04940 [Phormidesmis sp. 146-12]